MPDLTPLQKIKLAMRITTDAFDSELNDLMDAAAADLGIAGVTTTVLSNPLVLRAVTTYCRLHFGSPDEYDKLKASYDEQKAQMSMATGYTAWEG